MSDFLQTMATLSAERANRVEPEFSSSDFDQPVVPLSGACNNDVVCPEGDPWRDEIPSVAAISTGGSLFCTGFMVNNTAQDQKPYFMTAYHCGISSGNAASLVVYWNFETSTCGGTPDGSLSDFQTGSFFRSRYSPSDFALVELDSAPDPAEPGVTLRFAAGAVFVSSAPLAFAGTKAAPHRCSTKLNELTDSNIGISIRWPWPVRSR